MESIRDIDVYCIGLMVCDMIMAPVNIDDLSSDSQSIEHFTIASGGDALNVAINMGKLGLRVYLSGCVGHDSSGDFLLEAANQYGVHTDYVVRQEVYQTSTSVALVEENGERHFLYYGKSNHQLRPEHIDTALFERTKVVHIGSLMALEGLDGQGAGELLCQAKKAGAITSFDVTWDREGRWLEKARYALPYTDYFMPSLEEAQLISGKESLEDMKEFYSKIGVKNLVIKMGSQGSYLTDFKDEYRIFPVKDINVVDTTGAGDAYVSGFLTGIIHGWDFQSCGIFASASAAFAVSSRGATTGTKGFEDVMELGRQHGMKEFEGEDFGL